MKKTFFAAFLILVFVFCADAQKRKTLRTRAAKPRTVYIPVEPKEVTRSVVVSANSYFAVPMPVPAEGIRIKGRFRAQGGSGNDIEMFVLDEDGFENWKNGHRVSPFYNSGRLTVASFDFTLGQGQFYLVLNNKFSWLTPKAVTITFYE